MSLGLPDRHWIEKAKRQLAKRDIMEALADAEELHRWMMTRAEAAIDLAQIENIMAYRNSPDVRLLIAMQRLRERK